MGKKLQFAHLLGLARAEEKDDDEKKGRRAERDDDKEEEDRDGKKSKRAEDKDKDERDDDERAEEDDDKDEKDKDGKKGKRAKGSKRAEDDDDDDGDADAEDDDDDEEMRGNSAAARARRRERARCRAIFACSAAGQRPDVAASLAFETNMSRNEAIKVLTTTAAGAPPRKSRLDDRMSTLRVAQAGADSEASANGLSPAAAAIIAAGERARGK